MNNRHIKRKRKRKRSDHVLWQNPQHPQKTQKATWQHKNATKEIDYTTTAGWLRTVSCSNNSHSTSAIKPAYGIPTFPLTAKAVKSQRHTVKFVNNSPYEEPRTTTNQSGEAIKITKITYEVINTYKDIRLSKLCCSHLVASSGEKTEGVPTNNHRWRRSGHCLFLRGGLDKAFIRKV